MSGSGYEGVDRGGLPSQPSGASGPEAVVSLTSILNIFWRRRRILLVVTLAGLIAGIVYGLVTPPLYRARAQVRPGITAYSEQGAPVREWRLKDVVRWFRLGLYWDSMREHSPFDQRPTAPIIQAEFIAAGPQHLQGGQVVLLETLAQDPREAVGILRAAMAAFDREATADTLGSNLELTRGGIEVRITKLQNQIAILEADLRRADLNIGLRQRDLELVEAEDDKIRFELAQIDSLNALRRRGIAAAKGEGTRFAELLTGAERALHELLDERRRRDESPTGELGSVRQAAEMLASVQQIRSFLFRAEARADSLQQQITLSRGERRRLEIRRDIEMARRRVEIENAIADLELQKELDIPYKKEQLEQDIVAERVQLDQLSPLERIGSITVTDKPVRPRRLRAVAILTVLGFFGALFLALLVEYVTRNRDAILRATPSE